MSDFSTGSDRTQARGRARRNTRRKRDIVTLGIALAAIILFIGTAGVALPMMVRALQGSSAAPDLVLTNALLLNIALILLGWNRYKALNAELQRRCASEEEARRLADSDHLTGCLNRRSMTIALADLLANGMERERALAVIALDLDSFKQINDLNGHLAGDEVLQCTARRITGLLPDDGLLARLGGDEFLCVVPYHPQMQDRIDQLASRIIEAVATPVKHDAMSLDVTISVGIASSKQVAGTAEGTALAQKLMHKADIAMYHAKKHGKNRFYWFEVSMENELRFRNELETGIRKGIANGEFKPYYEQQVDLQTGKLTGFEMLARWESPELGIVGPDIFIPIAEEIGAIGEMSEHLIAQAFEDAKCWAHEISLSVNISPVQMRDPWFAQKLLKLLVKHNFPASRLDVEITESCLHENIGMVRSMITSLRNQGVHISLDDFGTGYSSLSQLRTLPFDRLKIDRAFVSELGSEKDTGKLVDAIVSMGDGLNLPITAEGVENEDVLQALKSMGKLKGQGYHYGKPEPAGKVIERLAAMNLLADTTADNVTEVDFAARQATPTGDGARVG